MHLQQLTLTNFKNCEYASMNFSGKLNCFVGLNGAGKTNILDAVYYLSFCKSYFNLTDKLNIRRGENFFSINGVYCREDKENELYSCIQKIDAKKSFRCNKKEYEKMADHIGKIPLVMISPYDNDLINGGSELRRKFVDGLISQFNPTYLDVILKYSRALLQRNILLKQFNQNHFFEADLLQPWNEQIIERAQIINKVRNEFLEEFLPVFQHYYQMVSSSAENVAMTYDSKLNDETMEHLLQQSLQHDLYNCYTNVGIHKDDFLYLLDQQPIKKFGSQGQQKSFVVAIKLAQFDFIYKKLGYKPIVLLDDIFDKLDEQRVLKLVHLVGDDYFGQVFITDTQINRIELLLDHTNITHKIFKVKNGVVSENID